MQKVKQTPGIFRQHLLMGILNSTSKDGSRDKKLHIECEYCFKYPLLFQLIVLIRLIAYILHNKNDLKYYV